MFMMNKIGNIYEKIKLTNNILIRLTKNQFISV